MSFEQTLQRLFKEVVRLPRPGSIVVGELRPQDFDSRGFPVFDGQRLVRAEDFAQRFE